MKDLEIDLHALAPLWTGGVDQKTDRLHETGLIGSLRWWYEALVRGLGGPACDPTSDDRCPDDSDKHCAACELFGCTGWARKFRLRVVDSATGAIICQAITQGDSFTLQFLPLRPIADAEKWLLAKALEIAATYGAVGGKTTLKPQEDERKQNLGTDYGLLEWRGATGVPEVSREAVHAYLLRPAWRRAATTVPDLRWFFFVQGAVLYRLRMNDLMGLSAKGEPKDDSLPYQRFLRGRRSTPSTSAKSKKVFSFHQGDRRVWGYAEDRDMRDTIQRELPRLLVGAPTIKSGEEVLREL